MRLRVAPSMGGAGASRWETGRERSDSGGFAALVAVWFTPKAHFLLEA